MTALQDTTPTWLDEPRAYRSVRTRRILSFVFDYTLVLLLCVPVYFVVTLLGAVTFGLGFLLYGAIFPLVAVPYVAFTMGGGGQATPGMRLFDLRIERLDGRKVDPALAILHAVLFWAGNVLTSGFVVLLALFTPRKQLVQDLLLGTVVTRRS